MDPRIDAIKGKMVNIIENTKIYLSSAPCVDASGDAKDGSIFSPQPGSVCISHGNLAKKLREDNLMPQINALVAHEFAHLAGLNEEDATFVQDWVLSSFSKGPGDTRRMLENVKTQLWEIKFAADEARRGDLNWNSYCFASEAIDQKFRALRKIENSGVFSFYDDKSDKQRNSFVLKNLALRSATCGFSDYHPDRVRLRENYKNDFGANAELMDSELEKILWQDDGTQTTGNVVIKKVSTLVDAASELGDLHSFAVRSLEFVEKLDKLQ
jgi:hypothetical protein